MSRYKALVVDFGGVLTTSLESAMKSFCSTHGMEMQHLVQAALGAYMGAEDVLVTDFETGRISEEDFSVAFAARLKEYSGVDIAHSGLVDRLFETLELEEDMFELIARAGAGGYKTALLSNSWGMGLYPLDRIRRLFDVIVISGEVGVRKPDPDVFKLTIDKLGVEPDACVFVDDHPGHLKAAREAGMTTGAPQEPGAVDSRGGGPAGPDLAGSLGGNEPVSGAHLPSDRLLAVVSELQGDPEVLLFERRDDVLQRVS